MLPFTGNDEVDAEHFLLSLTPRKPFIRLLPALHDLCELETSMTIIQPDAFLVLSQLPYPKQLTLCSAQM